MQDAYFQDLDTVLKQQGSGVPQLVVDAEYFDANLHWLKHRLPKAIRPRLVLKSLACGELLQRASDLLNTQAFMLFHFSHLNVLLALFPEADILFGKPMPIQAIQGLKSDQLEKISQIQWLIDSSERLEQYLTFAQQHQLQLRVNLEIDIGLHRGGFQNLALFGSVLQRITDHPRYLKLSGLMGYDAHVTKLPKLLFSENKIYQQSQQTYQQFIQAIVDTFPNVDLNKLTLNGAGSPTINNHLQGTVCNDLAFGSMLLKPHDFEIQALNEMQSAMWIATPVLKAIEHVQLPEIATFSKLVKQKAVLIYGGYWRGVCVYPAGAKPHSLYGRSSNQEMLQLPKNSHLRMDDYVFIQPSQSESIIPQFAQLWLYENRQLKPYPTFRE